MDEKDIRIIVGISIGFIFLTIVGIIAKIFFNSWIILIITGGVYGGLIPLSILVWFINFIHKKTESDKNSREKQQLEI